MFLKKIDLRGFKSFAREITIDFNSRLTAIVGPNGSGKSNIVDAVRWVLGEQSAKKLRGGKMADVIFTGSDDHRPLNSARVTLTLDNSDKILPRDANEIKITRKVNNDGQSDYYINESSCRLKDIQNLLVDSGLDTDSYAIVGQGQITSIINSRPEKLRELFEEAASILKHKNRKQEAEKRLDKTIRKLQRIKDLIWELEKQMDPLKKEKEKALKYRRLKDRLRSLEVNLLLDRWEKYTTELNNIQTDENFLQGQLQSREEEYKNIETQLEKKQIKLEELRSQLEAKKDKHYSLKTKLDEMKNKKKLLREKLRGLEREKKNVLEHQQNLKQKRKKLSEKKETKYDKIESINNNINSQKEKLNHLLQKLNDREILIEEKENKHASLQDQVMNDGRINELKVRTERLEEKLYNLRQELKKQREKKNNLRNNLDMLEVKLSALEKKYIKNREKINNHRNLQHKLKNKFKQINKTLEKKQKEETNLKNKRERVTSRLEYIKEREESHKGYYRGVRNIINHDNKFPGVIGTVADILQVQKKYEAAVEAALGSRLQNIIVEKDKTARECIKYLKENNKGRATFLPLNMVQSQDFSPDKTLRNADGFLGTAASLTGCSKKLTEVKKYLLGRILVAGTLEQAVDISREINSRFKIVTLDGDIINPGGAISGGSRQKKGSELLSRKRIIEELREKSNVLKNKLRKVEKAVNKNRNKKMKIRQAREKVADELQNFRLQASNTKNNLENIKLRLQEKNTTYHNIKQKIKNINQQLQKLSREKTGAEKEIAALNTDQSRDRKIISSLEEALKKERKEIEKIKEKITDKKVKLASQKQKLDNLKSNQKNLKQQLKNCENNLNQNRKKLKKIENKIIEIEQEQKTLKEQKIRTRKKVKDLNSSCSKLNDKIEEREAKYQTLKVNFSDIQDKVNELKDQLHKLELKHSRLEAKKESARENLQENYNLSPEEVKKEDKIEIQNYSQVKNKIKELKNSISSLGDVNTGAVKEFKELKARINYLYEQEQDLIEARRSLEKVISEIEDKMGEKFNTTYKKVKDRFENIFQDLFGGGKAKLELTEPDNLLKTGVEIIAQPPGKQLKKLSLMSGGERALTAIALVFAFLRVNPSPVYILDEIDAPLDDANVVRFSRFIREFSRFAQFIIITHRKQMMASVDTIYGVTMEESGISKLLSLELENIK